jgi:hypothetical protein
LPGDDLFQEDQQTAAQQNLQGDAEEAGADGGASGTNGSGRGTLIGPRILRPMGGFKRAAGGHDRVAGLVFDEAGGLLVVQSAGKSLEIFRWVGRYNQSKPSISMCFSRLFFLKYQLGLLLPVHLSCQGSQ